MKLFDSVENLKGYSLDNFFIENGCKTVIGIDEAGRGPLAGPVVASAVVLDYSNRIEGLNDSKKLSEKRRELLFSEITEKALDIGIGIVMPGEIDSINIFQATVKAMKRAVKRTDNHYGTLLIDGLSFNLNGFNSLKIIKGDTKSPAIMAASIIAKCTRDTLMRFYDKKYPDYSFKRHKGYPTAKHIELLRTYGPCEIHRKSFRPVSEVIRKKPAGQCITYNKKVYKHL